jgi:hypothetical protein
MTSEEEASRWRAAHGERPAKCRLSQAAAAVPGPEGPVGLELGGVGEGEEVAEIRERHNRARLAERAALELLEKAKVDNDLNGIRLALDRIVTTQERARDSREELSKARAAAGLLMARTEHDQGMVNMATAFQQGLEGLVTKSAKLAMQPVEVVHQILRDETNRTYERIRQMVA